MKLKKPAGEKLTIGLDLGDRRHHACVLNAAGEIVRLVARRAGTHSPHPSPKARGFALSALSRSVSPRK